MRILALNNEFPPLGGGTATVNLMLFRKFAAMPDLEIELITAAGHRHVSVEQFAERIIIHKVPVPIRNPHHALNRELAHYSWRAWLASRQLLSKRRYDLCMAWSTLPAGAVALALCTFQRLPFLVRIGGSDVPGHERRYRTITLLLRPLILLTWKRAKAIVVKCQEEAQKIRRYNRTTPIALIPNGVDPDIFSPSGQSRTAGPLRVIIVARLVEHKGHPTLFRALHMLVAEGFDLQLDVVGTGDAEEAYKALVGRLGLEDRVRFRGYLSREDVAACYREADVFVLPSEGEGMSVSTLEAMSSGLPVIVTRTGGTRDLVEEGVNGFTFEPGNVTALARHLKTLILDRNLISSMGAAARKRAERFTWNRVAEEYHRLFLSLAGKQASNLCAESAES
ncbi:MAG: glycosyltransferase family 4 protein [Kiritimatiellae bacterium]|nr:glycosyltransferase family 4 protein [Kiritimatiellia bacterium]